MRISDDTIQAVKTVSVMNTIGQYVKLKRHGSEYRGFCPFHDERTPSFYVHPTKGYKCFGCNAKGSNAIFFIMEYEKKTYPEAVAHLAGMAGIKIEQDGRTYRPQQPVIKRMGIRPMPDPVSFIPVMEFEASLKAFETNNFVKYLIDLFGSEIASKLISRYFIGSTNHSFKNKTYPDYISETGATIFWQIDKIGKVRTGKIMLYNSTNGKRIKKPFNHVNWVHSILRMQDFQLMQCFFGEHLLKSDPCKPVAIVESEKTAIIASIYLPQFIWLACGSLTNLNPEKCKVLTGRKIILFPDKGGFDQWTIKANELKPLVKFRVSDLLEVKNAEPKSDLADYLLKINYKEFASAEPLQILQPEITHESLPPANFQPVLEIMQFEPAENKDYFSKPEPPKPLDWEQEINELEQYFKNISLPTQPVIYYQCSTIINIRCFLETHFETLKANHGKRTFLPFLNRLQILKNLLKNEKD